MHNYNIYIEKLVAMIFHNKTESLLHKIFAALTIQECSVCATRYLAYAKNLSTMKISLYLWDTTVFTIVQCVPHTITVHFIHFFECRLT